LIFFISPFLAYISFCHHTFNHLDAHFKFLASRRFGVGDGHSNGFRGTHYRGVTTHGGLTLIEVIFVDNNQLLSMWVGVRQLRGIKWWSGVVEEEKATATTRLYRRKGIEDQKDVACGMMVMVEHDFSLFPFMSDFF
jgi:hypothetical protein